MTTTLFPFGPFFLLGPLRAPSYSGNCGPPTLILGGIFSSILGLIHTHTFSD
jgi:hypothetical protein